MNRTGFSIRVTLTMVALFFGSVSLWAQDDPGKTVLDKVKEKRGTELEKVQEQVRLLVVKGHFDMVEKVLDGLNIKYDLIELSALSEKDLSPYVAVFINCYGVTATTPGTPPGAYEPAQTVDPKIRDKARAYVEGGGYLFTSDWAIGLTATAFSEYLRQMRGGGQANESIPVHAGAGYEGHPFLKDVFTSGDPKKGTEIEKKLRKADWMIEAMSVPFEVMPAAKQKVQNLLVSEELQQKYGTPLVAVTFSVGKGGGMLVTGTDKSKKKNPGVVLHVLGHFYQQGLGNKDNTEVAKMYQMIVNFVLEAQKAQITPEKKKK